MFLYVINSFNETKPTDCLNMFLYVINSFNETKRTDCPFTPWVAWLWIALYKRMVWKVIFMILFTSHENKASY
jgi:hypothetical protein